MEKIFIMMTKKYEVPKSEFNKKYITANMKKAIKCSRRALNKILINGVIDHFTRSYEVTT